VQPEQFRTWVTLALVSHCRWGRAAPDVGGTGSSAGLRRFSASSHSVVGKAFTGREIKAPRREGVGARQERERKGTGIWTRWILRPTAEAAPPTLGLEWPTSRRRRMR
jgi:hypothetical protein